MSLVAIKYTRESGLQLLDQRLLPFQTVYLPVPDPQTAWQHIKDMVVRGAPAIGVTGALALAVHLTGGQGAGGYRAYASAAECAADVRKVMDYLVTSRPTAVNLADSAIKLSSVADKAAALPGAHGDSVAAAVVEAAEAWMEDDIAANKAIGAHGAKALLAAVSASGRPTRGGGCVRVLTHCNTGSLATAAYGTALGVLRALHEQGKLEQAYCTETRPYNQGARLTAFELVHDALPATLICDSAAAALMAAGQVDAVVVGADRVVANGDTANKIGTYTLALAAAHHGIPFFVAAPTTTLDAELADGSHIEIEQRPSEEITHFKGQRVVVEGIKVWNPCFDVTPGALIAAIITEKGLVPKATPEAPTTSTATPAATATSATPSTALNGINATSGSGSSTTSSSTAAHDVSGFMAQHGLWSPPTTAAANGTAVGTSGSTAALDAEGVKRYILQRPELASRVGPSDSAAQWGVAEVGDGNINFVWIVKGPSGGVCVKQSLPYVRCVGESWPLSQDRCRIEAEVLAVEHKLCPEHVPEVFVFDPARSIIAMELLAAPYLILRHGIIAGHTYPHFAAHTATFLAHTLFHTSMFALDSRAFRDSVVRYTNPDLCKLTEEVIFTDPYYPAPNNHHTSPQLDAHASALYSDVEAKVAVSALKERFCGAAEALVHGDLHTGSIMVTETATRMIDPEFAFVGPLAFDPAKIIGELLLTYFATDGWEAQEANSASSNGSSDRDGSSSAANGDASASSDGNGDSNGVSSGGRAAQRDWLLQSVVDIWEGFSQQFLQLWSAAAASPDAKGELYPGVLIGPSAAAGAAALKACQEAYMARLFSEVLGFAGAFIIRRLMGIAHNADMKCIKDADVRAACERRALHFGRHLLVEGPSAYGIGAVAGAEAAGGKAGLQKGIRAVVAGAQAARQAVGLTQ